MDLNHATHVFNVLLSSHNCIQNRFSRFTRTTTNIMRQIMINFRPRHLPTFVSTLRLPVRRFTLVRPTPRILVHAAISRHHNTRGSVVFTLRLNRTMARTHRGVLINNSSIATRIRLSRHRHTIGHLRLNNKFTFLLRFNHSVRHMLRRFRRTPEDVLSQIMAHLRPSQLTLTISPLRDPQLRLAIIRSQPRLTMLTTTNRLQQARFTILLAGRLLTLVARNRRRVIINTRSSTIRIRFSRHRQTVGHLRRTNLINSDILRYFRFDFVTVRRRKRYSEELKAAEIDPCSNTYEPGVLRVFNSIYSVSTNP